ncbi:serine threonine kinase [Fusarium pseudoanthophilum]|uniref:Serine threonine kinase n=1 Tax=Fusarium pseudoanthophilum TaxID=48495 RepID=A0A8H5KZ70_9HYPO|nr:serine threonine kinase [Fusarium pseudoanthophilum]
MSGIEVLGAVAACFELSKILHSLLTVVDDARVVYKDGAEWGELRFHLLVQVLNFESWCKELGISGSLDIVNSSPERNCEASQNAVLEGRLRTGLRLDNKAISEATIDALRSLTTKFKQAQCMLQPYEPSSVDQEAPKLEQTMPKRSWLRRLRDNRVPQTSDIQSIPKSESKSRKIYGAVKWVSVDRKVFSSLMVDITRLNTSLLTLLEVSRQQRVERQTELALLDSSEGMHVSHLPENSDFKALVKLKSFQDEEQPETMVASEYPKPIFHVDDIKGEPTKVGETRSICQLHGESVLVEWRFYRKENPIRIQRTSQLLRLVNLLNQSGVSGKFLAPKCKGLITDDANSRIGIIFSTVSSIDTAMQTGFHYQDLQSFIRRSSNVPPLEERFKIARRLALAVHHLHSVQWLHKSFRSDNVVFFDSIPEQSTKSSPVEAHGVEANSKEDVIDERELPSSAPPPLPDLYLVGWDFSRPDDVLEFSESISLSSADFQSKRENMTLYSHPKVHLLLSSTQRSRFCAEYDIYSLGLVLLEVGLWRTLDTIRRKCNNDSEFRRRVRGEYCDKLLSKTGKLYWRATQRCLAFDFDTAASDSSQITEYPLRVAFEQQVVSQLELCKVAP